MSDKCKPHVLDIDVVVVADPRGPWDGHDLSGRTLPQFLKDLLNAGASVALLQVITPQGPRDDDMDKGIAALLAEGCLQLLSTSRPVRARLAVAYHLAPFLDEPDRRPQLACDEAILRVEQDWDEPKHQKIAPFETILSRVTQLFGAAPLVLREQEAIRVPETSAVSESSFREHIENVFIPTITPCYKTIISSSATNSRSRILMLSPNGIGMGHLTRQLAIARFLPKNIEPVFLSMSQAVSVVERFGFHGEYLPGPQATGVDSERWRVDLARRLIDAVTFYDARALVFDGNYPYEAMKSVRAELGERTMIWLRRGLWRPNAGRAALARSGLFDLVIEPLDYAVSMDRGVTASADDARKVAPIVLLDAQEQPDRAEARKALGLPEGEMAVLIQLGSGANFDTEVVHKKILEQCSKITGLHGRVVTWLIADRGVDPCEGYGPRFRRLQGFPLSKYLRAFDFAVSAAGYNSFHELSGAAIPTIFVPNDNPSMDEQEARAMYAERLGISYYVPARDPVRLHWAIERMCDPVQRRFMSEKAQNLQRPDGAAEAAALITMHAKALRTSSDNHRLQRHLARW